MQRLQDYELKCFSTIKMCINFALLQEISRYDEESNSHQIASSGATYVHNYTNLTPIF